MNLIHMAAGITALFALSINAEEVRPGPTPGEGYEISKFYKSSSRTNDGSSSGSSSGRDTLLERVIGVGEAGLELEYDLPADATAQDRAREWGFPARVLKPSSGPMRLLNDAELEARVDPWLKKAGWTRAACGRLIFTWNAFRIECDPQSVIKVIEEFDLRSVDLRDGVAYRDAEARGPMILARRGAAPAGATFAASAEVDPDIIRRARAKSDVSVGELMRKPVTLDAALRERAKEAISGTIYLTFETDAAGNARRRVRTVELRTKKVDGSIETETMTETVERRLAGPSSGKAHS